MLTPRRNIPVKKDLWWLTGPKSIIRVQQLLFTGGLSHMLHFKEKPQVRLPSLLHHIPAFWSNPFQGVPEIILWPAPANWTCTSIFPIGIFTDQSEWLQNDQWGCDILNNQGSAMWTDQTANLDSTFAWKWTKQGPPWQVLYMQGGDPKWNLFKYKKIEYLFLHV